MNSIELDDTEQLALPYTPDWQSLTTTFSVASDLVASLTQREERAPLGETLRVRGEWSLVLSRGPATELRNALRTIDDTPVRIPFWPAVDALNGPFGSRWWMGYTQGDSAGEVGNVTWEQSAVGQRVPTLLGYLDGSPSFRAITPELVEVGVRWQESSESNQALTLATEYFTTGPSIGAITRYVFPFSPNWLSAQEPGSVLVNARRDFIGPHREAAAEVYPQVGTRAPRLRFTLSIADAGRLVRFFSDRKGSVEPFWLPGSLSEVELASNTSSGSANVTLVDASPIEDFSYIAFLHGAGQFTARKILSRVGNVLTLDSSPGDLAARATLVCTLALVRFASNDLTVKWNWPIADVDVAFTEVNEYASPTGDTLQTKLGDLPARALVFKLDYGGSETLRLATWDAGLISPYGGFDEGFDEGFEKGVLYDAAAAAHNEIQDGPAWDRQTASFRCRYTAENPLRRVILGTSTERVWLTVMEVTPGDPWTNERTLFSGVVTDVSFDGTFLDVEAQAGGMALDRRVPRTLLQLTDNHELFTAENGLDRGEWTFSATLTGISGRTLTFGSISRPGGLPTVGADYFALGYIERPSGASFERIAVASSTALSAGSLTVELVRALSDTPSTPESGWSLIPGYDGSFETSADKFDNADRFGGFPFVPASNPSIIPKKKDATAAGKK